MKTIKLMLSVVAILLCASNQSYSKDIPVHAKWAVIGAGPTGILAMGIILDNGVNPNEVVWIDPNFNVGRMGSHYQNVPGNGTVRQYISLIESCNIFKQVKSDDIDLLYTLQLDQSPKLKFLVNPMLAITKFLCDQVVPLQDAMVGLDFVDNQWQIKTTSTSFYAENVMLATGAHPKIMQHNTPYVPLDLALDKKKLAEFINPDDTVAVIGSGHSALLIVRYLTELSVSRIINFYNKPVVYPIPTQRGIVWQETGLKGELAKWTRTVLEVNPPQNLIRIESSPEVIESWLPKCTKVIYAVGFERNDLPPINGDATVYDRYDCNSCMVGPHCFGAGIAFPQEYIDPQGNVEYLVGLPYLKFSALREALAEK